MQMLAPVIQQLGPARARMIARLLMRVDMLSREHVLMVLPGEMLVGGMGWEHESAMRIGDCGAALEGPGGT